MQGSEIRSSPTETDLDAILALLLNTEDPEVIENFWQDVDQNLKDGRIRLVFVSDSIRKELRRIVEFLNGQMERTEVLAVEIKQFEGGGARVMVPRVIGLTEVARQSKGIGRRPRPWTVEELEKVYGLDLSSLPILNALANISPRA